MPENKDYILKEEKWFREHLNELLPKNRDKWAVVFKQELLGIFDSFTEAYEKGIDLAKSEKILVRQIREDDKPREISINYSLGLFDAEAPG